MKKRPKTLSKYFYDDEILKKDSDGVIHLKEGVRRVLIWPQLKNTEVIFNIDEDIRGKSEHINEFRRLQDKIDLAYKIREEERNFND